MIGGLLSKSVSRVALFAAAGLFMGGVAMPSAKAADLGGDCCADLDEQLHNCLVEKIFRRQAIAN